MMLKFLVIAVSCIFIEQIHHVHCQDSKITTPPPPATVSPQQLANATADKTINTLLRHLRLEMTHPVSAATIRYIMTAARELLTSETGQKNVQNVTDFIVNVLMDKNTLDTVKVLRKRLVELAASGRKSAIVLGTAADSTRKILDEPQLLDTTEGAIEGINCLMENMTEQKLRDGIARVVKLQKFSSYVMPKAAEKTPTAPQKLKRTNSDAQINYKSLEGDKGMQLQTRSLGWGEEHPWINKNPKLKKNKKDQRDDINGDSDIE